MKSWRNALVGQDSSLEQAIRSLDSAGLRIALVVDDSGGLLGTLTDGDVRRALLNHLSLNTPVRKVMNATPKTARRGWPASRLLALMEEHGVLHLPVLDDEDRVAGLASLHDLLNNSRHDNPVFLMAGGFGTRLRPLTNDCPKPMLRLGDRPILERILLSFVEAGFHRFYISTHYMPEVIRDHFGDGEKWGVSIEYVHEESPLGTGGALGLLPQNAIDLPVIMMNGDLVTSLSIHGFLEFHDLSDSVATVCVREYDYQVPYGVVSNEGTRVSAIIEKPIHKFFVNAGIYLLNPELVLRVKPGLRIDMPTLLEQEIAQGRLVSMFPIHEHWMDIGRMIDFQRAQSEATD